LNQLLLISLLTACTSILAFGQTSKIQGDAQDRAAIEKLMKDIAETWNKHDVVAYSRLFAEDADFTNWRGTLRVHGREEIKNAHAPLFTGMFRQSKMTVLETARVNDF
jgi:uncharacterized protein (TIGR02246 family)